MTQPDVHLLASSVKGYSRSYCGMVNPKSFVINRRGERTKNGRKVAKQSGKVLVTCARCLGLSTAGTMLSKNP